MEHYVSAQRLMPFHPVPPDYQYHSQKTKSLSVSERNQVKWTLEWCVNAQYLQMIVIGYLVCQSRVESEGPLWPAVCPHLIVSYLGAYS